MSESKIYRKVSTAGLATDPEFQRQSADVQFWWRIHMQSCLRRGIPCGLSIHWFALLCHGNCTYCGSVPERRAVNSGWALGNGVDRVDNSQGYTNENTVTCCKTCNSMKSGLNRTKFLEHVLNIAANAGNWP